jgi:hypothetical protein
MTKSDLSHAEWRRSSQDGNCVEVACNLSGLVAVCDSKETDGTKLVVSQKTWRMSMRGIHA